MIVFDLVCPAGHRFEGWFASSAAFGSQQTRGLVACPQCGSADVVKAPMAPAVPKKGNQMTPAVINAPLAGDVLAPPTQQAFEKLARIQARLLGNSRWVGKDFAQQSREMHYGERDVEVIHGQASLEQARDLIDEGVPVLPLPFPVAPPEDLN